MDYAAEAMNYVATQIDSGVNVTAINCSWGSSDTGGLGAAVANLLARDVLIVKSAGNSNSSSADFLGGTAGVINVAATDSTGAGASFSNHGSWVDLAAPGDPVLSTYANPDDPDLTAHYIAILSGTSMSAPHVAGAAALLESKSPTLTGPEKFTLLVDNTTPYSDARDLGSGILNINNALGAVNSSGVGDSPGRRAFPAGHPGVPESHPELGPASPSTARNAFRPRSPFLICKEDWFGILAPDRWNRAPTSSTGTAATTAGPGWPRASTSWSSGRPGSPRPGRSRCCASFLPPNPPGCHPCSGPARWRSSGDRGSGAWIPPHCELP